jgi:type IX secretion system PorP/SprF family membrane protein
MTFKLKNLKTQSTSKKLPRLAGMAATFIALMMVVNVSAQDLQFTQFYSCPQFLNPAYTGQTQKNRFVVNYRNQWPAVSKTFQSYMAAYDHNLENINCGIGVYAFQDRAGSGGLVHTQAGLNYAYRVEVSSSAEVRGGINASYNMKNLSFSRFTLSDQYVTGASTSLDESNFSPKSYLDLGAGLLYSGEKGWAGITAKHINQPNVSLVGNDERLPVFIGVNAGLKFDLGSTTQTQTVTVKATNENEKDRDERRTVKNNRYITAGFNYRHQYIYDQLDIGLTWYRTPFYIGAWYRGIPFKMYAPGFPNNESVAIIVGLDLPSKYLRIGYSFDLTISKLKLNNTMGAHEVSLTYEPWSKSSTSKKARKTIGELKF